MKKIVSAVAIAAVALVGLSACTEASAPSRKDKLNESQASFDKRVPPKVTGDAEYNNYIKAQEEVYDNPASIIWCTAYPENPSAPIFTVPIAGKLTSSSVSFFPNSVQRFSSGGSFTWAEEAQSVDGMYHGSPAPYRYGFTPGGQYVDFTSIPTFCTTQLTEFQRQTLKVAQVETNDPTAKINELMKQGKTDEAQALADSVAG